MTEASLALLYSCAGLATVQEAQAFLRRHKVLEWGVGWRLTRKIPFPIFGYIHVRRFGIGWRAIVIDIRDCPGGSYPQESKIPRDWQNELWQAFLHISRIEDLQIILDPRAFIRPNGHRVKAVPQGVVVVENPDL